MKGFVVVFHIIAVGFTKPVTDMSTGRFLRVKSGRRVKLTT
jgi:hypothetical protein